MGLRYAVNQKDRSNYQNLLSWLVALGLSIVLVFYGPGLWLFQLKIPKAEASALSFICASSASTTSTASCSGETTGDLLLVFAYRSGSITAPTTATGFTSITTAANNSTTGGGGSANLGRCTAGSGSCPASSGGSGTWTNATNVVMQVYRGFSSSSPVGTPVANSGSNSASTVTYNAATLSVTDGSSWWAGFAGRGTADTHLATAPTGMTNRTSTPATPAAAGHDTNGPTSSNWASTSVSGFGAASKFISFVIELKAAPVITVGATGTATANMNIPSTANWTGGAFTFVRDVGSANVTSIKVTATGTVNANTNMANLILYYKQEAVCESSFPSSGTTQFNSTAGSFASGTSTVTGTMAVGTTQVCIYAKVDVGSGATNGQTFGISINNPGTDVVVSAGTVLPATAVAPSGSTTLLVIPTTDQLLRGGEFFSGGSKQKFYWAN